MEKFHHVSVLFDETMVALNINPDGVYVDCTLGGAGHALGISSKLSKNGRLIGIDQDEDAIIAASERLTDLNPKIDVVQGNFRDLAKILDSLKIDKIDGCLFDLGVSSHQIDTAERGFSYIKDGPLDMRMDKNADFSAKDVINKYTEEELGRIFKEYGEERWGNRIAKFICNFRKEKTIETTFELIDIIDRAIPKDVRRNMEGHSAKRIFQAVRIEVNHELDSLEDTFKEAALRLNPKGRLAIITFHSLEDRIAKKTLKELSTDCICPKTYPICLCNHKKSVKLIGKPIRATGEELNANRRAKSATLRVAEKLER
ncbi:MAG: 16S rRNA (cytosine(1402)-N(4))-methyltransferase RsmH [Selenomonadaceae bacterium]|nr:16S rRNA (cytosine(1402)-N(4))-methyltransferase RsmH [Selenomonadaceae bacterium]